MANFDEVGQWVYVTKPENTDYNIAEKTTIYFNNEHSFVVGDYLLNSDNNSGGVVYEVLDDLSLNLARDTSTVFSVSGNLGNGTSTVSYYNASSTHGINNDVVQRLVDRTKWLYDNKVDPSTLVHAGIGLVGGGDLSDDVALSLGLPSTITSSSTNIVTGTTHTHSIDKASNWVEGITRYATNEEYLSGLVPNVAIAPNVFLNFFQKNQNGYQRFPGGLILQWGFNTSGNLIYHPFPVTFPTMCFSITVTINYRGQLDRSVNVYDVSNTGYFTATPNQYPCYFMAIGY